MEEVKDWQKSPNGLSVFPAYRPPEWALLYAKHWMNYQMNLTYTYNPSNAAERILQTITSYTVACTVTQNQQWVTLC